MNKYLISDLAMENSSISKLKNGKKNSFDTYSEEFFGDIKVCRMSVKKDGEESTNRYITICTPSILTLSQSMITNVSKIISSEINVLLKHITGKEACTGSRYLIAGMGNREIASDSIGALTVNKINITRHIELLNPSDLKASGACSVCAVECGVMGKTGMRTLEVLRGIISEIKPDAVIAIDALAARSTERLAATIQLSDAGISPGAGIGNRQSALTRETLGVPIIAVGIPTVVSAATLVYDMLGDEEKTVRNFAFEERLEEAKKFFVAPKECDIIADASSRILADALDRLFGVIK